MKLFSIPGHYYIKYAFKIFHLYSAGIFEVTKINFSFYELILAPNLVQCTFTVVPQDAERTTEISRSITARLYFNSQEFIKMDILKKL